MLKRILLFLAAGLLVSCSNSAERVYIEPPLGFEIPDTPLPLAEFGPYKSSKILKITYYDEKRGGREISITVYFPAVDGEPDLRGAPFPLIILDHNAF